MSDKDLKAAGIGLLAANPGMEVVYMANNGQGFADKHDAEVCNDALGLKGKEGGAIKVSRGGNEKAIEAEVANLQEAHEAALAASLVEQAKIREEKKALKEAKQANRKGERVDVGGDSDALKLALAENEALKAKLAELEAKEEAPAAEAPAVEQAPKKSSKK